MSVKETIMRSVMLITSNRLIVNIMKQVDELLDYANNVSQPDRHSAAPIAVFNYSPISDQKPSLRLCCAFKRVIKASWVSMPFVAVSICASSRQEARSFAA